MSDAVDKFHAALAECAFTEQHLPSIGEILTGKSDAVVSVAPSDNKLEDITPKKYPLKVFLDRAAAEKKKDALLAGFAGWSITAAQPQPFTNLCMMEIDGQQEQWTDYQGKVLVAMAVAKAMGWASLYEVAIGPALRMHPDPLHGKVPAQIEGVMRMLAPMAEKAMAEFEQL